MTPISQQFKALGHPNRLLLIEILSLGGPKTPTYLSAQLGLSISLVVHHLNILKNAGLIKKERIDLFSCYTLRSPYFKDLKRWLNSQI